MNLTTMTTLDALVENGPHYTLISGKPLSGKTTLVKNLLEAYKNTHTANNIIFFSSNSCREDILSELELYLSCITPTSDKKYIIVFDDVWFDNEDESLNDILPKLCKPQIHVICTIQFPEMIKEQEHSLFDRVFYLQDQHLHNIQLMHEHHFKSVSESELKELQKNLQEFEALLTVDGQLHLYKITDSPGELKASTWETDP